MYTIEEIRSFKGKYPKQLWYLFLSEMWERFCFYGMRGVLTIFMIEQLLMTQRDANLKYGAIQAFVYTMTFVGGFFADKILGFRKSIFWGGLLMIIGSLTIAFSPTNLFYIGTSISIVGTGFFKPNISGVVGLLYHDGDKRRDAGFALFYSGINIGALLGGWLCFKVGDTYGWEWAFIVSGIAMFFGLLVFALTKRTLGPLGFSPLLNDAANVSRIKMYEIMVYIGSLLIIPFVLLLIQNTAYTDIFMLIVGPSALIYLFYEMTRCDRDQIYKLLGALVFIIFSIFFWAFFEQSGGSLAIVARNHLNDSVAGLTMDPNEVNNSANSLFVILLSPLFGLLWLWLHRRNAEPNTVIKFGLGFVFLAIAFYVFHSLIGSASPEGISSLTVFAFAYLIITIGELCLSPIGLSMMTKLSPKRLIGIIMGLWFLASAYGQYIAGILGAGMASAGEFNIQMASEPGATGNDVKTITWADTAAVRGTFQNMDITFTIPGTDTIQGLVWKPGYKDINNLVQVTATGDTVNWRISNTPNDGSEQIRLPASIAQRSDITPVVEPVSIERLKSYTDGYKQLAIYALICGAVLMLISPLVRKLTGEVR